MARTFAEFDAQTWARTFAEDSDLEVLRFFCSFYEEMPCYHFLYELLITRPYVELSTDAHVYFWDFLRRMLSSEHDALSDPAAYVLWSDFFESDSASEAWSFLVEGDPKPKLIERILIASGPVPYPMKEQLYAKLIHDQRWHHYIFRSIYFSMFDTYGQIEKIPAARILARLNLPGEDFTDSQRVWAALAGSPAAGAKPPQL